MQSAFFVMTQLGLALGNGDASIFAASCGHERGQYATTATRWNSINACCVQIAADDDAVFVGRIGTVMGMMGDRCRDLVERWGPHHNAWNHPHLITSSSVAALSVSARCDRAPVEPPGN